MGESGESNNAIYPDEILAGLVCLKKSIKCYTLLLLLVHRFSHLDTVSSCMHLMYLNAFDYMTGLHLKLLCLGQGDAKVHDGSEL